MSAEQYTIRYGTEGDCIVAKSGTRLLDVILSRFPEHLHVCGGNGLCTSCRVRVESGDLSPPNQREHDRLGASCGRLRLACQAYIVGDVTVQPAARAVLIDWD